jgi:hypothetical protein
MVQNSSKITIFSFCFHFLEKQYRQVTKIRHQKKTIQEGFSIKWGDTL